MSAAAQLSAVNNFFEFGSWTVLPRAVSSVLGFLGDDERNRLLPFVPYMGLDNALIPKELIKGLKNGNFEEPMIRTLSEFVINSVQGCLKFWNSGFPKKLDPNPGDCACQIRGYLLYSLAENPDVQVECRALQGEVKQLEKGFNVSKKDKGAVKQFYQDQLASFFISKKMVFLLQCYVLAVVRKPNQTLPNGIVMTITDASWLSKLSKKIGTLAVQIRNQKANLANQIVMRLQSECSANSLSLLTWDVRASARWPAAEKEDLVTRLGPLLYTPDKQKYEAKTFSSLFYSYKALLGLLKGRQSLLCFSEIVPQGKQVGPPILFQNKGEDFEEIPSSMGLTALTPVVVFQGVFLKTREIFLEMVRTNGLTTVIMIAAAVEPYYGNSAVTNKNPAPQSEEIEKYRKLGEAIGYSQIYLLDHVYMNNLRGEGVVS